MYRHSFRNEIQKKTKGNAPEFAGSRSSLSLYMHVVSNFTNWVLESNFCLATTFLKYLKVYSTRNDIHKKTKCQKTIVTTETCNNNIEKQWKWPRIKFSSHHTIPVWRRVSHDSCVTHGGIFGFVLFYTLNCSIYLKPVGAGITYRWWSMWAQRRSLFRTV